MFRTFRGGYDVLLDGRPSSVINESPLVSTLYLPLHSKRLTFSNILVSQGDRVTPGHVLAMDTARYECPLLAPCTGTVDLEAAADHITLKDVDLHPDAIREPEHPKFGANDSDIRRRLVELGVWQFFSEALTGAVPDPSAGPRSVIVSTLRLDSFVTRGDILLKDRESDFSYGIKALQSAAPNALFYIIVPDVKSDLLSHVLMSIETLPNIEPVRVPLRYPFDNPKLLAGKLGLNGSDDSGPIWTLGVEAVLAATDALLSAKPCTTRVISLGGPGVAHPDNFRVPLGYPIQSLISACKLTTENVRVINGGALSGYTVPQEQLGVDVECAGLTIIPEQTKREFISFAHPGFSKHSYCRCLLSLLRIPFREQYTTAMQGEQRPCFSCNFCDEVCPAEIMPFMLHRYLSGDILEEADKHGIAKCIGCGLCSYVCPAKIDLTEAIVEGQEKVQRDLYVGNEST